MTNLLAIPRAARRLPPGDQGLPPVSTFTERVDTTKAVAGADFYWRCADSGITMSARDGGFDGIWVNLADIDFQLDPIVASSNGGKSVALGAAASNPGYGIITVGDGGISLTSQRSIMTVVQVDAHAAQHVVLTMGGMTDDGQFTCELISDGQGGLKPRVWTVAAGSAVVYVGSSAASVPIGQACVIEWRQFNGGLGVRVNGQDVALTLTGGTPPASWAAAPEGTLYVGVWPPGFQAPFNGLIAEIAIWNTAPLSVADGQLIATPQSIVAATEVVMGSIAENATTPKTVSVLNNVHPEAGGVLALTAPIAAHGTPTVAGTSLSFDPNPVTGDTADDFGFTWTVGGVSDTALATITVTEAGGGTVVGLPYFGEFFGTHGVGFGSGNSRMRAGPNNAAAAEESTFFYADRTGTVTRIHWHWRTKGDEPGAYSNGDGGVYTLGIKAANPSTKMPVAGAPYICRVNGIVPGNPGHPEDPAGPGEQVNRATYHLYTFTQTGQLTAKQPYCIVIVNTHATPTADYASINTTVHASFYDDSIPITNYVEPGAGPGVGSINCASGGINPDNVGFAPAKILGWTPVKLSGAYQYPWPYTTQDGNIRGRRVGDAFAALEYSDGVVTGAGAWGGENPPATTGINWRYEVSGANQYRFIFRPYLATHVVTGVFIWGWRASGTGNLNIDLLSGPTTDAHNPSMAGTTLLKQVAVDVNMWLTATNGEILQRNQELALSPSGLLDLGHWVWVPFGQNITLTQNAAYTLRITATGTARWFMQCGNAHDFRAEFGGIQGRATSTWANWIANNNCCWQSWPYSRGGSETSTNGGANWAYKSGKIPAVLFKCGPINVPPEPPSATLSEDEPLPTATATLNATTANFDSVYASAAAGSHIVLANGNYGSRTLNRNFAVSNRIVIRAATLLGATFTRLTISGDGHIVSGFNIDQGATVGTGQALIIDGSNLRITRCDIRNGQQLIYFAPGGVHDILFDHCEISRSRQWMFMLEDPKDQRRITVARCWCHELMAGTATVSNCFGWFGAGSYRSAPIDIVCRLNYLGPGEATTAPVEESDYIHHKGSKCCYAFNRLDTTRECNHRLGIHGRYIGNHIPDTEDLRMYDTWGWYYGNKSGKMEAPVGQSAYYDDTKYLDPSTRGRHAHKQSRLAGNQALSFVLGEPFDITNWCTNTAHPTLPDPQPCGGIKPARTYAGVTYAADDPNDPDNGVKIRAHSGPITQDTSVTCIDQVQNLDSQPGAAAPTSWRTELFAEYPWIESICPNPTSLTGGPGGSAPWSVALALTRGDAPTPNTGPLRNSPGGLP